MESVSECLGDVSLPELKFPFQLHLCLGDERAETKLPLDSPLLWSE